MTKRQRILLFSSIGLLAAAILLLNIQRWIPSNQNAYTEDVKTIVQWQAFPTRAAIWTPIPDDIDYETAIRSAILRQEFDQAHSLLREADTFYPGNAALRLYEVRLAMAQNDYSKAESLVWEVIGINASDPLTWVVAGTVLRHQEKPEMADQAFATALELNPYLAPQLFQERWEFAVRNKNTQQLTELADEYYLLHPDDPIADYYMATALRASGQNNVAMFLLVERIAKHSQPPAVLWYILGLTYLDRAGYRESAVSFEQALELYKTGDTSMQLASNEPEKVLTENLANAYLGFQRCASAEALFRRLAERTVPVDESYAARISDAVSCQTPTPTPTHWMISKQN